MWARVSPETQDDSVSVSSTAQIYVIGVSLSEPHINGLSDLVLVAMVYCTFDGRSYFNFGFRSSGDQIYLHLSHHAHCVAGAKLAATRKGFKFSLRSASNDHYIE